MSKNSLLQRVMHRLASSNADLESEEMQRAVEAESAVPIRTCEDRQLVRLRASSRGVQPRSWRLRSKRLSGRGHARSGVFRRTAGFRYSERTFPSLRPPPQCEIGASRRTAREVPVQLGVVRLD